MTTCYLSSKFTQECCGIFAYYMKMCPVIDVIKSRIANSGAERGSQQDEFRMNSEMSGDGCTEMENFSKIMW